MYDHIAGSDADSRRCNTGASATRLRQSTALQAFKDGAIAFRMNPHSVSMRSDDDFTRRCDFAAAYSEL
jgi:hypothetical protein